MELLSDLFTARGALADTNGDGIADTIVLRFVLPEPLSAEECCALADFAAVIGLHVTGFSPPLVVDTWDSLVLTITHDPDAEANIGRVTLAGNTLTVSGADSVTVAAMLRALANGPLPGEAEWAVTTAQYPAVMPPNIVPLDTFIALADPFMREGDPARLPGMFLDTNNDRLPDDTRSTIAVPANLPPDILAMLVDLATRIGIETTGLTLPLFAPTPAGDIGSFAASVRHLLMPQTSEPYVPLAEPQPRETVLWSHEWQGQRERDVLLEALQGRLPSTEDGPCSVRVQISEPAEIRAAVREELRAGLPDGSDVTVLPVYHAGRAWLVEVVAPAANVLPGLASLEVLCQPFQPMKEPCLDLRIRWLQECWPADELIAPFLDLPLEAVRIALGPDGQPETYIACARDEAGEVIGQWAFLPPVYPRAYLSVSDAPEWVHASTGDVVVRQGGRDLYHATIPTDLDRFWDEWQHTVLATMRDYILALNDGKPTEALQPFFDELRVEVWVSEPEYALNVREERESPAEGLAEDIYFNALDAIAALGKRIGEIWEEPGQIVPLVHVTPGEPPRAAVSLIRYEQGNDVLLAPRPIMPRTMGVAMDEVVKGENLPELLAYLEGFDAVRVRGVGASYRGRPMAAVEIVKPDGATVRSRTKLAATKLTHLIVARHHANEVASTTAALTLIEQLATDTEIASLLDRVNVIVIPDENPDGTALHARLMAEHPTWKHHAARYNAVGVEFTRHFDNPDTPYGEARVRPLLWRQWRPDVVTDNHGVPTHEWWQPFAGGTSPPRFRISYWLCQALVYGICRYAPDDAHTAFAAALRDAVSVAVAAEPDLAAANGVYAERYARWGQQYLPAMFPATYHGDMLWFFTAAEAHPDVPPRDISLREPQMVSASWVTEVLDETAGGAHLALVAKAHLTANLAALRLTADHAPPVSFSVEPIGGGRYRHRLHRLRPLRITKE